MGKGEHMTAEFLAVSISRRQKYSQTYVYLMYLNTYKMVNYL